MPANQREKAIFDRMEKQLYSAVISDILDEMGVRDHSLSTSIHPIRGDMVIAGRSKPILASRVFEVPKSEPYKLTIEVLDSIKQDEIPVVVASTDARTALWGELFSTASRARGARGTIIDGFARDTRKILQMDYALFCSGTSPTDSKGRAEFIRYDCQIRSGDATINPGDIVFADGDGIVTIPREIEREVLDRAYKKAEKEDVVRDGLLRGQLLSEAWRKHKVL
jgi:4-hydroxy-4-methyl-2-oxoglutarate aldolase